MTLGGALAHAGWLGLPGSAAWGVALAVPGAGRPGRPAGPPATAGERSAGPACWPALSVRRRRCTPRSTPRCSAGRRPTRPRCAARSPSCSRSATRRRRSGDCLAAAPRPARGSATCGSSSSTTARPTAPPTWCARWPTPGSGWCRPARRRRAGWASRTPAPPGSPPRRGRRTTACWCSSTPTSGCSPTPSPARSRCSTRHDLDLVSPWPRPLADGAGRAAGPAARALALGDDAARCGWPSARRARRWPPPPGSSSCSPAAAYDRAGGHAAVRGEVLEDIALLRAVKRSGGRGGAGRRLAAGRLPDVRRLGRRCATATPSRCGARSAAPRSASAAAAGRPDRGVGAPAARGAARVPRRAGRLLRPGSPGAVVVAAATGSRAVARRAGASRLDARSRRARRPLGRRATAAAP